MKKQLILVGLLVAGFASAQTEEDKKYQGNVGINTMTPQTTLDIAANTADGDKVEGLMVPRITYAKMQAMKANLTEYHDGLMVYVTDYMDINTGQSKDGIYAPAYYSPYFVYNGLTKQFIPFSPSGLTEVVSTGQGFAYALASKIMGLKAFQTPIQLGANAIDLSPGFGAHQGATGDYSFAAQTSEASGNYSFATQRGTASGEFSTALGDGANASADYAIAMGAEAFASADHATALGYRAQATGQYTTALGQRSQATGENSFAVQGGIATGEYSIALGYTSFAQGQQSFAMQGGQADGANSIALGYSKAEGDSSFSLGGGYAKGIGSIALGSGKAEGDESSVIANGTAKGFSSLAIAAGITTNTFEIALGKNFNTDRDIETDTTASSPTRQIFSVGRNTGSGNRQNALIILRNAHTGIGLPTDITTPANSKPTEMLDVNGNIKVRGTQTSITEGAACTNAGTISYATDGNFYGCTGQLVWKKLNN